MRTWCNSVIAIGLGLLCLAPAARGDRGTELTGTWQLVASVTEKDGVKRDQFGDKPTGLLMLDEHGRFMLTIIGPQLPAFVSGNRAQATADEGKAVVAGTIAMVGRYAYNAGDKTLTFHVDASTFPNWAGTTQQRIIVEASSDTLEYVTPTASSGGVGRVTWRRAR